jgi:hypothetical protein
MRKSLSAYRKKMSTSQLEDRNKQSKLLSPLPVPALPPGGFRPSVRERKIFKNSYKQHRHKTDRIERVRC